MSAPANDVYARLLRDRIVFVNGTISDATSTITVAQMLFHQHEDRARDIHLYVKSPGGSVTSSMAIYDTMQYVACDVATYAIGEVGGTATMLLCAGKRGKRYALPDARISIGRIFSTEACDSSTQELELERLRNEIFRVYARHTGQDASSIERMHVIDAVMTPHEARKAGLIDEVLDATPGRSIVSWVRSLFS